MVELSEQQLDVLRGIANGDSTPEIAERMGISPKTVEYHRSVVYNHLAETGVRAGNYVDLAHYCIAEGLVDLKTFDNMRFTFKHAKKLCALDDNFEITSDETFNFAMKVWKEKTVAARNANDDALAAELSQCKELFKRRHTNRVLRVCPKCGGSKSTHAMNCSVCARRERFYPNEIPSTSVVMKEHEIEEGLVIIGPRCHQTGVLTSIIRKLASSGNVGDSFITDKQSTSIKNVARMAGMEVIVRIANPEEKDKKKRRYRVWRSDGKSMEEVNEIIRKRMAGETVPPSPPCVPPPADQLSKRHSKRKGAAAQPAEQTQRRNGP